MEIKHPHDGHPFLQFPCPATQELTSLAFGYSSGEPMMVIFRGEEFVAMLSREVLIAALREGWGGTQSGWWGDPGTN